ncbi:MULTISPECIES: hypothetical protein [unclassified Staphylococcus]|uniref:hypothetical protein n=1 Tax=unclassified Staphylococcus TaxID=91994 RepID=UPI0021CEB6B9|nr:MULTISPECIES: hypothetical protein [unclassified Staphylococcus]UXR69315.1 hypothetical protein MUA26_09325 [Staphylococcus sp. IVB6246]UXR73645.1 hypothetical protein MUA48_09845 [Staphylococcus sp. IVB6238]UXR75962.1 hypothetical protein MUA74_09930 [Staphylococcus sp. IVB6233]UXR80159.1 hypothetical protein MUA65_09535 [Staphylococcus sp. IVB6218]
MHREQKILLLAAISNIILIAGIVMLIYVGPIWALACFLITLTITLVLFNMLFKEKPKLRRIANVIYAIVILFIVFLMWHYFA